MDSNELDVFLRMVSWSMVPIINNIILPEHIQQSVHELQSNPLNLKNETYQVPPLALTLSVLDRYTKSLFLQFTKYL